MSLFHIPTGEPIVRVAVMAVTFMVELPDDAAGAILRRVVPAGIRHRRPDGSFVVARSRQRALIAALEKGGYRVDVLAVSP